ncbi:methyl-accepting chemotaxis protein [Pelobacter sp. M08fum]|uniref:Methyl-accepting chemotaxis protein n=2 Tax=Pelovirga terrestris TaxID=2771352 RepID=A0A8J6QT66_9BACT|nr:methyl-accepting chemotaxis protein [Pelovirga terrestris]MBD1401575.1 methyl-accepting chemotaxis protein [Pelovirga terrestris]
MIAVEVANHDHSLTMDEESKEGRSLTFDQASEGYGIEIRHVIEIIGIQPIQVADSSQALSQGATVSASSLEEISASLNQLSSQTETNAENANTANPLVGVTHLLVRNVLLASAWRCVLEARYLDPDQNCQVTPSSGPDMVTSARVPPLL